MMTMVSPALKALLSRVIDYAGTFPPAALTRPVAVENFEGYLKGSHAFMLRYMVVNACDLEFLPQSLDGALAVVGNADEPRAAVIEAKGIVQANRPVYAEVPLAELEAVQKAGCLAKIRTGGLKAEAIPAVHEVAAFIVACAKRKLPFKATAGLHHAIRAEHPLTYETASPRATMHGFLNVLMASAFAFHGQYDIEPVLAETDVAAFFFDEQAHWRDWSLDARQIEQARQNFIHAFGSCSFSEPVDELESLKLLG